MKIINFYIPSETCCFLDIATSTVNTKQFHFRLGEENGIFLRCNVGDITNTVSVPKEILDKIIESDLLTHAVVNQWLQPLKEELINRFSNETETTVNLSSLLLSARGYVLKEAKKIALFDNNALILDTFTNTMQMMLSAKNTYFISAMEYVYRNMEPVSFILFHKDRVLRIESVCNNCVFQIKFVLPEENTEYKDLFEKNIPLSDIYQKMIKKPTRLNMLARLKK